MFDRQPANQQHPPRSPDSSVSPVGPAGTRAAGPEGLGTARQAASPTPTADLGRVRAVINALPEAVFVTESDGDLRLTNPAADRLFEGRPVVDRSDLLARFEEISPNPGHSGALGSLPDATRTHLTVRPRDQPNRLFTLRTVDLDAPRTGEGPDNSADPDPKPSPTGQTVFVLRDVTESRDLRPVREAFLAVLSHELRTPITTIYAGSSVLARRPSLSPSATRNLAADISSESARLYDLVEDLLVLARLERRVLDPLDEPVLVRRSVDSAIRMIIDRVGNVAIERAGDADVPPVHGDATYVDQACRNLIMASIRYAGSGPGRQVVVDVRSDPVAGEVTVAVLDRGPSLTADELHQAFELPTGAALGRLAGSGVGPFVARQLVEAMGGRVWARNRPDGGLETGFALPIDART